MDRFLEQYNREYVKKVMINQQEIFKQQVRELHRLYKVQKMLMIETNYKFRQTYDESIVDCKLKECDIDLTLSIGCKMSSES
ncbi:hypothetical protein IHE45_09G006800 [Dioscorea alata]|uniref:Uncharacterized protein n=1 Tax=Dioscorea alata TaxID=55571 RepID=A0ACB7VD20_DIOAL|nr:hypothetical protein IHE45_09G006800 [Dioscorea alata]